MLEGTGNTQNYWNNFNLNESDLVTLHSHLNETCLPQKIDDLVIVLIKKRINEIKEAKDLHYRMLIKEKRIDSIYHPTKTFAINMRLIFPKNEDAIGTIIDIRYNTLDVKFESGELKSFVSNNPNMPLYDEVEDQSNNIQEILHLRGNRIAELLTNKLRENPQFTKIQDYWFPSNLIQKVLSSNVAYRKPVVTDRLRVRISSFSAQQKKEFIYQLFYEVITAESLHELIHAEEKLTLLYDLLSRDKLIEFHKSFNEKKEFAINRFIDEVAELIGRCEYQKAISMYLGNKEYFPKEHFLESLLKDYMFFEADATSKTINYVNNNWYIDTKSKYVKKYFEENHSFPINNEQSFAISQTENNVLVKARAGSGKTRVISAKISFLIDKGNVKANEILSLAFNKKAAAEIRVRLRNKNYHNTLTFHSLAYKLVSPEQTILLEDKQKNIITQSFHGLFSEAESLNGLYEFFRKEAEEVVEYGLNLHGKKQYAHRRSLPQMSLDGKTMNCIVEKYVSDFLFEHDVDYRFYSRKFKFWVSKLKPYYYYVPFYFTSGENEYVIVIWDEKDEEQQRFKEDILIECQKESYIVIQLFEEKIMRMGRNNFEEQLSNEFICLGIDKPKLERHILEKRLIENPNTNSRLANLFLRFIQRAKKLSLTPESFEKLLMNYYPTDEREDLFLQLASKVFSHYESKKKKRDLIDFDDLLSLAIEKVRHTRGDCVFKGVGRTSISLKELKWVLIDEFQDSSELFNNLIEEIMKFNPQIHLFCVGDDWQAINGFAGSDLKFFKNFPTLFKKSKTINLLTNHRSLSRIIKTSNKLMLGLGEPANFFHQNIGGEVTLFFVDDVWIPNDYIAKNDNNPSEKDLLFYENNNKFGRKKIDLIPSQYLVLCHKIITSKENLGKKTAILSRTNTIQYKDLDFFREKLMRLCKELNPEDSSEVEVSTVHSYKGLEADNVIVLDVTRRNFPLIHPDNSLLKVLGRSFEDSVKEERRLFYVAITRAKSKVYLISDSQNRSDYLAELELQSMQPPIYKSNNN